MIGDITSPAAHRIFRAIFGLPLEVTAATRTAVREAERLRDQKSGGGYMTAPEIYKSIALDGLTDSNRAAFQALPNAERLGLHKALAQDYPDIARELEQGLPKDNEADAGVVAAAAEQSAGVNLSLDQPADAATSPAPVDSVQDHEVHTDPVETEPPVVPPPPEERVKQGHLPDSFPGRAQLEAAGITTYAQLRKEVKSYTHLTHIEGIGEATDAKILAALEE